tara:strand:+ start:43 stop:570 length:528 start_codon:yes stop_codon:yes gene_type:complete
MSKASKGVLAKSVQDTGISDRRYVEAKKPKETVLALEMIGNGEPYRKIEEETGLGWEALVGIKHRHAGALEKRRQQLANDGFLQVEKLRYVADKKLSMLAEDDDALKKVNIKDLIISQAVAQDKSFAAIGEGPKAIVEHRGKEPSIADAMKVIADARAALQKEAVPVDVVEVEDV